MSLKIFNAKLKFLELYREYERLRANPKADPEDIAAKRLELIRAGKKAIKTHASFEALRWFGTCYIRGSDGFPVNIDEGIRYLNEAVLLRSPQAMSLLGDVYSGSVNNVPEDKIDFDKAIKSYIRASDLGDGYASYRLAQIYLGEGSVERDLRKVLDYLEIAALKQQNNQGKSLMARWIYIGEFMQKDFGRAYDMFSEIAESCMKNGKFHPDKEGCGATALYFMGRMSYYGEGVEGDDEKGMALIEQAALYGDEEAMEWLENYNDAGV